MNSNINCNNIGSKVERTIFKVDIVALYTNLGIKMS